GSDRFGAVASMRPRPQDRGEHGWLGSDRFGAVASMRPRPQDRGEPNTCREALRFGIVLQCGHGRRTVENRTGPITTSTTPTHFNAATVSTSWRTKKLALEFGRQYTTLQCGHGHKTVEKDRSSLRDQLR